MDLVIIILLMIAGIFLFMAELFLIPGISIAGISAAVCLLYTIYYAFQNLGFAGGIITTLASMIGCVTILIWFMRSKTLDKLALKKDITSKVNDKAKKSIKVGDMGIAVTRLALIGNAEINNNIIEVKSMDGLLNEKTPLIVDRIEEGVIMVKKI